MSNEREVPNMVIGSITALSNTPTLYGHDRPDNKTIAELTATVERLREEGAAMTGAIMDMDNERDALRQRLAAAQDQLKLLQDGEPCVVLRFADYERQNAQLAAAQADADIHAELERAIRKFPTWPTDPLHAVAVVGEEVGELVKEVLQFTYEPHKTTWDEVRKEAVQAAAMAIRFCRSLDLYVATPGVQHSQEPQP